LGPASIKAEIDALPALRRMIQAGLGHAIFPLAAAIEELAASTLAAQKIVDPVLERHVALISLTRRPRTHQQRSSPRRLDSGLVARIETSMAVRYSTRCYSAPLLPSSYAKLVLIPTFSAVRRLMAASAGALLL
jgi:hypothetical protein